MKFLVLASGLLVRNGALLLVRCRYEDEPEPLWTLPGGRQEPGEPLARTVQREFREEAGLDVTPSRVAYVSDSVDRHTALAVVNCTFWVDEAGTLREPMPADDAVICARFVPLADAPQLLEADVLRIPVVAALAEPAIAHYFSFDSRTIRVPFFRRTNASAQHG
ncbi:MAG: NUDIX hydrolase [Candidatus Eremiobacteraeota bacterium]|nr:NUDIX hydrolase [Candidatus Eremiobacteraeota bacterium]